MPKENKKRGRHGERKRKREEYNDHGSSSNKKLKDEEHDSEEVEILLDGSDAARHRHLATLESPGETPFYGLLDDEEQEYFRRADEMLEVNQFADVEERTLFLTNVYREANGKELKIASSQSCSRLMERLILLSTADQLKALFGKFSGQYVICGPTVVCCS
jgi:nucleolar protein 9